MSFRLREGVALIGAWSGTQSQIDSKDADKVRWVKRRLHVGLVKAAEADQNGHAVARFEHSVGNPADTGPNPIRKGGPFSVGFAGTCQ